MIASARAALHQLPLRCAACPRSLSGADLLASLRAEANHMRGSWRSRVLRRDLPCLLRCGAHAFAALQPPSLAEHAPDLLLHAQPAALPSYNLPRRHQTLQQLRVHQYGAFSHRSLPYWNSSTAPSCAPSRSEAILYGAHSAPPAPFRALRPRRSRYRKRKYSPPPCHPRMSAQPPLSDGRSAVQDTQYPKACAHAPHAIYAPRDGSTR